MDKAEMLNEAREMLDGMSELEKTMVLAYMRMLAGEDPNAGAEVLQPLYDSLLLMESSGAGQAPADVLARLSAMLQPA